MKKRILLLTGLLVLILAACGGQESATPESTEAPAVETEATEAPPTEAPPTEAPAAETATEESAEAETAGAETAEAGGESSSMVEGMEHEADPRLVNVTWEWVRRDPNGNDVPELTIANPENYTLFFNEDGTFNATLDCNTGSGVYATPSPGNIFMELGATTRAACPPESHDADMMNMFGGAVQSYRLEDDDQTLVMVWVAGGPLDYYRSADAEVPGEAEVESIPEDAIQLNLNGLATSYAWQVMPGNPIPVGPGGQGFPPHILVTFDGATADEAVLNNLQRMYIFPTEAYVNLYQANGSQVVAEQVVRLGQLISTADNRTELPESPMPLLPPPGNVMDRWFQFQDLDFGVGRGVRYVSDSPYRQSIGVWANDTIGYFYQGLTTDQTFYVSLYWPVSTDALPATAADAPQEQTDAANNPDTYPAYAQETKDALNALPASAWSPDLTLLDGLASSLTFPLPSDTEAEDEADSGEEEAEAEEPAEEEEEAAEEGESILPEPEAGEPSGTVTAPDGIYVRSGPGTEYPDITVAAYNDTVKITGVSEDSGWWVIEVPVSVAADQQGWVSADWVDASNAGAVPVVPAPNAEAVQPALTGVNWQWVSTTTPAETITVNDPTRYTILFNSDSSAQIKADCNNVGATYTTDGSNISITPGPSTLAACPPDSLDQQYLNQLAAAAIYFFQDGDLLIDMAADAGTMRFTGGDAQAPPPESTPAPETPTSPVQGLVFNLVSYGPEGAEQSLIPGTQITASFTNDTVSGNSDCNDYTGQLTPVDEYFTVGSIAVTQKICTEPEGVMDQEQAYLAALQATAGYQWQQDVDSGNLVTGGRLLYFLADGTSGFLNFVTQ